MTHHLVFGRVQRVVDHAKLGRLHDQERISRTTGQALQHVDKIVWPDLGDSTIARLIVMVLIDSRRPSSQPSVVQDSQYGGSVTAIGKGSALPQNLVVARI